MARSLPEWVGASDDAAIPTRVKLRVWERCGGRCAITGKKLMPGDDYDFDHETPLHLGGQHRERNLRVVSRAAHREKSAREVSAKAKCDRVRAKHLGVFPPSKARIRNRGFSPTRGNLP